MDTWFLDSEFENAEPENAAFHVIPFPLEETVSYMGGTEEGPKAILEASGQLEQLVEGYGNPGKKGIHTTHFVDCILDAQKAIDEATTLMIEAHRYKALPVLLGGEHSVTNAAIPFIMGSFEPGEVGILQFDAHMDLRHSYQGSLLSHACVMRRAVEAGIPLFQVGIRNFSEEDLEARKQYGVGHFDASFLYRNRTKLEGLALPSDFPTKLYITFDVDGFDASLMGATGTPDPGGLGWWDAITLLECLTKNKAIIGFDVVELAPNGANHCPYTAAKLVYYLMGLALSKQS